MKSSVLGELQCFRSWMKMIKSRLNMFRLRNVRFQVRNISIHEAIRHSDAPALARHLVANTDVNIHDKWGLTPLHIAAEKGDARLVQILFGMGADPGFCSTLESGWIPPVVVAASYGHLECLDLLLTAGAQMDATDRWGNTAILKACSAGHFDCVSSLLRNGADPTIPNHWSDTCLHACATLGFQDILTSLLASGCYDITSDEVQSALATAASKGFHQCVEILLNAGCSPDRKGSHEEPQALFFALTCRACDEEELDEDEDTDKRKNAARCVTHLIKAGARITTTCLELLSEVMCQNEGRYFDTTIEVVSAMTLNLNQRGRFSLEYNAIGQLFYQLTSLTNDQQSELIHAILKLGYKPTEQILNVVQDNISEDNLSKLKESSKAGPLALQNLTKLTIRSLLNSNVTFAVQSLPLPVMLKKRL